MKKKGRGRKKHSTAHLRKYWFKKKKKGSHRMARKKRKSGRRGRSRSTARRTHRRSRSRGSYGSGLKPTGDQFKRWAAAAGYGYLEGDNDKDAILNKVPKPIDQLGFTGNIALVLWALGYFTKNHWVKVGADSVATIASYQLGRRGKLFSEGSERFKISGWSDDDVAAAIEEHVSGVSPYGSAEAY